MSIIEEEPWCVEQIFTAIRDIATAIISGVQGFF